MSNVTHLIVSDSGLIGNIHRNTNPFCEGMFIVSIGESFYSATTLDRAVACAIRNMPKGSSIIVNK